MRLSNGLSKAILGLIAVLALLALPLAAEKAPEAETPPPTKLATPSTFSASGMIAHIDPETGELRQPTPEEAARLRDAMAALRQNFENRVGRAHTIVEHANGMISAELDPALHEFSVVSVNPDGSLSHECVKGEEKATAVVLSHSAPAPQEEQ
ncbi:MAG: hypothetical protein AAF604_23155 [Acidobacteriota bacterium]